MKTRKLARLPMPYAKVLIVDDVPTNLIFAKGILKPYKMQVDCAASGIEAIELIRNPTVRYDAIFMDQMMPEIDGIESVRIIREEIDSDYARSIPIIALTASETDDDEKMFLEKGFQAFLNKPIDAMKMDTILRQWVCNEEHGSLPTGDTEIEPSNIEQVFKGKTPQIEGLDWQVGLSYCAGNKDHYLSAIHSYVDNVTCLTLQISSVTEETLADYTIRIHGIKGSSYAIGAKDIGKQAEELEHAAREGNFQLVSRNTLFFVENTKKLLNALTNLLKDCAAETSEKPSQYTPSETLLDQMDEAAVNFKIDELEESMKLLECFKYEAQSDLIVWLHEKVNQMEFLAIHERLVQRKREARREKNDGRN